MAWVLYFLRYPLFTTNLQWSELLSARHQLADILFQKIPAGVGREGLLKLSIRELDRILRDGAKWALKQGYGCDEDLLYVEERGQMANAVPENVSEVAKKRQHGEMGT